MNSPVPPNPKIYHIVHGPTAIDHCEDGLLCDADMAHRPSSGTMIGMRGIKQRRLVRSLNSHPGLRVGGCVPFYFCPRSVMLYLIHMGNHPELEYRGGQKPIVHLEADLRNAVSWAEDHGLRWAFTLSNAGSRRKQGTVTFSTPALGRSDDLRRQVQVMA